jgi:hypothetical protein
MCDGVKIPKSFSLSLSQNFVLQKRLAGQNVLVGGGTGTHVGYAPSSRNNIDVSVVALVQKQQKIIPQNLPGPSAN